MKIKHPLTRLLENNSHTPPGQVRKQMVSIEPSRITLIHKRSIEMKPEIVEIDDIKVICVRETGSYEKTAPEAWGKLMKFAYSNKLMGKDNIRRIGISHDNPNVTEASNIRYDACIDIDTNVEAETDLRKHTVSGWKYAKFLHIGAYEGFQETFSYIFNEWLPESNHTLRGEPCFEIYLNKDPRKTKPENLKTEIYIPIE